jgi:hypothetical protein
MVPPASGSRLQIDHFRSHYLVPAQHPAPEQVKARLDEPVAQTLAQVLAATLGPLFCDTDPSVWLIRRLELTVDVNSAWEREQLARAWVGQIGRELDRVLRGGTDGENVVWFPDRAAYLAHFLRDVASGQAWSRWYYADFQGLRLLPVSAAVRTAVLDEPETGLAALAHLPDDALARVVRTLTVQDARLLLERLSGRGPTTDEARCFQVAWQRLQGRALQGFLAMAEPHAGLLLLVHTLRDEPDLAGPSLRMAAAALVRLAHRLLGSTAQDGARLVAALSRGDLAELFLIAGAADAEALQPLFRCPPGWVQEVGRAMLALRTVPLTEEAAVPAAHRYTPFGAVFVLLPLLDELPLEQATRGWPGAEGVEATALVRALLLAKACGQERASGLLADPLVCDLVGLAPTVSADALCRWQSRLTPPQVQQFLATLAGWRRAMGAAPGPVAILARLPARGRSVAVLLDGARGVWLWAGSVDARRPGRLVEVVRDCMPDAGERATLLCDDRFVAALQPALAGVQVQALGSLTAGDSAARAVRADLTEALSVARLDRLPDDLAYLALPAAWRSPRHANLALSVAAQGVLRDLAWRLPGFARSGLPYLYANFLDFSGSVEEETERRVVRLGRPPLHLVLHITGLGRRSYRLAWLDERPFVLFPEE